VQAVDDGVAAPADDQRAVDRQRDDEGGREAVGQVERRLDEPWSSCPCTMSCIPQMGICAAAGRKLAPMARLVLLVLPLGLDTLAVSAALGLAGLPRRRRLRVSLVLAGCETAMPLAGLAGGRALGALVGGAADWAALLLLAALGAWLVAGRDGDDDLASRLGRGGLGTLLLGLSVSVDELAVGLAAGLLHLRLWLTVGLIAAQALVLSQLGLRLGERLGASLGGRAERLAGAALLAGAGLVLAERLG
jgi:manganese efflux pump family protein